MNGYAGFHYSNSIFKGNDSCLTIWPQTGSGKCRLYLRTDSRRSGSCGHCALLAIHVSVVSEAPRRSELARTVKLAAPWRFR